MSDLPPPLVGSAVDLSGLDGFMLNVQRLFASELWALSTGAEFKAAIALYGRAWQQTPPGSLPNDERILAQFSGAGRDWKRVRAIALRGFVECSDGRLYHRVLCEDVNRAHAKRQAFRARTSAASEARRRQRDDDRNDQRNDARNDDVTSLQGQGQGQGQGQKEEKISLPKVDRTDAGDARGERDSEVDLFRRVYPKDTELNGVKRELRKILDRGDAKLDDILAGAKRYAHEVKHRPDKQHIASPVRWLLDGRWRDHQLKAETGPVATDKTFVTKDDPRWPALADRYKAEYRRTSTPIADNGWYFPNAWIEVLISSQAPT